MKKVRLGSGSAFWGDALEPAVELAKRGNVQYIGFDHLAELTLSIFQRIKLKDPTKGYIPDLLPWTKACLPDAVEKNIKLISNAGAANPEAGADEVVKLAESMGYHGMKVGVVTGDDIFNRLDEIRAKGVKLVNLDTGEDDIDRVKDRIVAANAYIGCEGILETLAEGAQVIVTGRATDNALYVGPMMHEFGWKFGDIDKMGAAVTIGHIIECAGCVTGGMSNMWNVTPEPWNIGFPIVEVYDDATCLVTKAPNTGGIVNQWTVKEHLVYEVHDPSRYLMADGIGDFTSINIQEVGPNQVRVTGMKGKPRPDTLKVCIGYQDGWIGEGEITLVWPDAYEKAKKAEEILRGRFKIVGLQADELRIDFIGINSIHGALAKPPKDLDEVNEVRIRVAAKVKTKEEADKIRREITHLWTTGPVGVTGVTAPPPPRPVVSLWPTLVPRDLIPTKGTIKIVP